MSGRSYLYGRGDPELWGLLRDGRFGRLLYRFFSADGAAAMDAAEEDLARRATARGLLTGPSTALAPGPRLVLIPRQACDAVIARLEPVLGRYVGAAGDAAAALAGAFADTAAARRFRWADVAHSLVAGMLLDLSVGSRLWLGGQILRAFDESVVWVFEEVPGRNAFGVQWVAGHR